MTEPEKAAMRLMLELFVSDLEKSRDFYTRVLGFEITRKEPNGYTALRSGQAQLAITVYSGASRHHNNRSEERPGRGVEVVLEVDDVEATCARVQAAGWPLASSLKKQSWGLTDFRIADPDGYRLRICSQE